MLTVACVCKSGGIYTPDWVYKLKHGVSKHLSTQHKFVALTDHDIPGVTTVRLRKNWPGWWSKIELFTPNLFSGPVLYFDLDVLITGQIDDLPSNGNFTMCADFLNPLKHHNSSVMSWSGDYSFLFEIFEHDPAGLMHRHDKLRPDGNVGDQSFTENALKQFKQKIDTFPDGRCVSYKRHCKGGVPPNTSVVAFHGKPKPNLASGWPQNQWNEL